MRKLIRLQIVLVAVFSLQAGIAQSEVVPEILVSGTIIADENVFENIPREVITAQEIAALGPATVIDLLRGIAGVDVTQQDGPGGLTFVSIRGGDPNFTVVIIDGVKVDDPTNSRGGGFDFAGLDALIIERIEIFFGSYSAVYGSDALGGVISVTTKGAHSSSTGAADLEVGTNDVWAGALHVAGPVANTFEASIAVAARQGNDAVVGNSLERQQIIFKLRPLATSTSSFDWGFNLFASNMDVSSFPQASGGDQLAVIRKVEEKRSDQLGLSTKITWSPIRAWRPTLAAAWNRYREESNNPGIASGILSGVPPVNTNSAYDRANIVFSNTLSLLEPLTIGFGTEFISEKGRIESLIDFGFPLVANFKKTRNTWSVFGEAALKTTQFFNLIATIRHDDAENIQSTTARIAANLNFTKTNTSAWLIYGEGFKLPSLFALGHPLTGNPALKPERSENIEFRIEQTAFNKLAEFSFSVYRNKFSDLVDFDSNIFLHVNRSNVVTRGVDVELKLDKDLRLGGNISYLNADTGNSNVKLEHRPKWNGSVELSWKPTEALSVSARGVFNGRFFDSAIPTGLTQLGSYERLDANIQWAATQKLDLGLFIDNILNDGYQESIGFSNPGRQLRLIFSAHL